MLCSTAQAHLRVESGKGALEANVNAPAEACPTCVGLLLYSGALKHGGFCKNVPNPDQNLQVCALQEAPIDVHLTFNAGTPLHITVRTLPGVNPPCEGNRYVSIRTPASPPHERQAAYGPVCKLLQART